VTRTVASIDDVAQFIGKDERTIRRWISQGLLKEYTGRTGKRGVCVQDAIEVEARVRTGTVRRERQRDRQVFLVEKG